MNKTKKAPTPLCEGPNWSHCEKGNHRRWLGENQESKFHPKNLFAKQ